MTYKNYGTIIRNFTYSIKTFCSKVGVANRQYLIHGAFKSRIQASPWKLEDSELAFALNNFPGQDSESAVIHG